MRQPTPLCFTFVALLHLNRCLSQGLSDSAPRTGQPRLHAHTHQHAAKASKLLSCSFPCSSRARLIVISIHLTGRANPTVQ